MKTGVVHRIPVSNQVACLLEKRLQQSNDSPWVFSITGDKPISDMTLTKVLRDNKIESDVPRRFATAHGFRSTFREWSGDQTSYPREVIEHALAHQLKDKAEAAYYRKTMFPKRIKLMNAWSNYCDQIPTDVDNVIGIRKEAQS